MNFDKEDPRWTAYILNELNPEERAELDAILAVSEEAREYLALLKSTVVDVNTVYNLEAEQKLSSAQKQIVTDNMSPKKSGSFFSFLFKPQYGFGLAGLVLALVLILPQFSEKSRQMEFQPDKIGGMQKSYVEEAEQEKPDDLKGSRGGGSGAKKVESPSDSLLSDTSSEMVAMEDLGAPPPSAPPSKLVTKEYKVPTSSRSSGKAAPQRATKKVVTKTEFSKKIKSKKLKSKLRSEKPLGFGGRAQKVIITSNNLSKAESQELKNYILTISVSLKKCITTIRDLPLNFKVDWLKSGEFKNITALSPASVKCIIDTLGSTSQHNKPVPKLPQPSVRIEIY